MHRTLWIAVGLALLAPPAAFAQSGSINWLRDAAQAVKQAEQSGKPIMFYVVSRQGDRPDEIETAQKESFRNPIVGELSKRFVCSQLSRSRFPELLEKWGLPPRTNLEILFVTPQGDKLGAVVSPSAVAEPKALAQRMADAFDQYRTQVFDKDLKPVLEAEDAKPAEVKRVLTAVRQLTILSADAAVKKYAEREGIDDKLRQDAYETLAALSTSAAVDFLFTRGLEEPGLIKTLVKCTPGAAGRLVDHVGGPDAAKSLLAYNAVVKICKIKDAKTDKFWESDNTKAIEREIERVNSEVKKAAARWKERYEPYR